MTDMHTPSRHERRREQTREQLIRTTLRLILERGYDAITIQDITEGADLGRGTFYIYFKDKAEVFWAAVQDMMLAMEQTAHRQLDRQAPGVEYAALCNIFTHAEKNRDLYLIVLSGQGPATLIDRVYDLIAKMLLDDIRNAPKHKETSIHIPDEVLAQMLTGLLTRTILWWLNTPNKYSVEEMAVMIYKIFYRRDPPAARPEIT